MRCCLENRSYTIYGYKGKQVRDNIHSGDLVNMFWHFFQDPGIAEVYNAGGGRYSNCSMQEAITLCQEKTGLELNTIYDDRNRTGDHIWYISDIRKFESRYPDWSFRYDLPSIVEEIYEGWRERL